MEIGKSYPIIGYTVQGPSKNSKGRPVKNPRIFGYPKLKPTNKGLSIRVKKVTGFGQVDYLEIVCYGDSFQDAKKLNLQKGELVDCYGRYEVEEGKKFDFRKIVINDPMQIRRFSKRAVKASEL